MRRRWADEQLIAAAATATTIADICRALGLVPRGGNYEGIRQHAHRLGVDLPPPRRRRPRVSLRDVPDERFAHAVAAADSIVDVCRKLGFRRSGGLCEMIRRRIVALRLDVSHFERQPVEVATVRWPTRAIEELLQAGHLVSTPLLRIRLIREGLKQHRCEECGLDNWRGTPIPLELDHVNGDRWDNRLANLRLLCPNCHALTPTYRGRNIGRRRGATG